MSRVSRYLTDQFRSHSQVVKKIDVAIFIRAVDKGQFHGRATVMRNPVVSNR